MKTFRVIQGDSFTPHFRLVYADGQTPVNLTGCTVQLIARNAQGNVVMEATTLNGKITLDALNGDIFTNVPPADTLSIAAGNYRMRLRIIYPNAVEKTVLDGTLIVKEL